MPYIQVQDVRLGMDRKRKLRAAGELGSAWTIKNGHLTRGGDVDRRKKFVDQGVFPDTTDGLFAINETLYTQGFDSGEANNVPSGVTHILNQHPTPSTPIREVRDATGFDGKLYSIIEYTDGNIYHFYDVNRITDWDTLSSDIGSNDAVAQALTTAIDKSPTVSASVSGNVITVTGEPDEDFTIQGSTTNNGSDSTQSLTIVETQASGGGNPQINTITVGGSFEPSDQFIVTIANNEEYVVTGGSAGTGTSILTYKKKLYSTASSNLYFSSLNAPTQWISGVDYGFINMASQVGGQEKLVVAEEYQGLMAIFSESNIRIWSISEASDANVFVQNLRNTGTIAPKSVVPYGNNDVFYLNNSGVRSIKARDSSNAAYVSDVGTNIDTHIRNFINTLSPSQVAKAVGIIEPIDGRFWIAIDNRIYVLSYFPSARVSAWSYYEVDFKVKFLAKIGERIYARGTDSQGVDRLYLYGGLNNDIYPGDDEDECKIEFPYFSANDPAGFKDLQGFDIIAINEWKVEILPDPDDESKKIQVGTAVGTSYGKPRYGATGISPLFAIDITCSKAGKATFSALAMHYQSFGSE